MLPVRIMLQSKWRAWGGGGWAGTMGSPCISPSSSQNGSSSSSLSHCVPFPSRLSCDRRERAERESGSHPPRSSEVSVVSPVSAGSMMLQSLPAPTAGLEQRARC